MGGGGRNFLQLVAEEFTHTRDGDAAPIGSGSGSEFTKMAIGTNNTGMSG
jgi:hypothetical protein